MSWRNAAQLLGGMVRYIRQETRFCRSYRRALAVRHGQSAKFWEIGAALELTRLWSDQGMCREAHNHLALIYS